MAMSAGAKVSHVETIADFLQQLRNPLRWLGEVAVEPDDDLIFR